MELNEIKCSVCPHKVDKRKLAAVAEEMCDKFCRWHNLVGLKQEELEETCETCPLNKLVKE